MNFDFCEKCPLKKSNRYVEAEFATNAKVLFVGEAPGETEVTLGQPFVGMSGQILRNVLDRMDIVYNISNIVKCRPTTSSGKNRTPTSEEIKHCFPLIEKEVQNKKYKLIVLLGRIALNAFFPDLKMKDIVEQIMIKDKTRFLVLYHPSYIARNRGTDIERKWIEDLLNIENIIRG